jgi:hypothetical protein
VQRTVDGLIHEHDAILAYANTTQRVAEIVVENDAGRPTRILDAKGRYWSFESDGLLSVERLVRRAEFLCGSPERPKGTIVDLRPEIARKKWKSERTWDLTKEELDRVVAAIVPSAAKPLETVRSAKGKAPRRPPLTYQGERAAHSIALKLSEIEWELWRSFEAGLKGLAFHCREMMSESASASLWRGIADIADLKREIKARHRTGRGAWFAIVELMMWNLDRNEGRELETIEEKCADRKTDIAASRRLLAEHTHRFDENVTAEASVKSELEWPLSSAFDGNETT